MKRPWAFIFVLAGLLFFRPFATHAETVYFSGAGEFEDVEINGLIAKDGLAPSVEMKSTLVHKTEHLSIHLVQMRHKERPHIHNSHDLFITLKKGEGTLHMGGRAIALKPGDSAFIARGVVHYFENGSESPAAALVISAPPYDPADAIPAEEDPPKTR